MNLREKSAANDEMTYTLDQLHLWQADTIRSRCREVLEMARRGELKAYEYFPEKLNQVADFVIDVTRSQYPDLDVPPHSRWRHFEVGGTDRWAGLRQNLPDDNAERQRCATELTIISVLLDAGAGAEWKFTESGSGETYTRSEGLALASLQLYQSGHLSSLGKAMHVDASGLCKLSRQALGEAFQVSDNNPLIGLESRLQLLHQLGQMVATCPSIFGREGRLGELAIYLQSCCGTPLAIDKAFSELLKLLAVIWPERIAGEVPLGDVWRYGNIGRGQPGEGLVPFHKLTQWMTYSLIEAWQKTGIETRNESCLTALAEYRNGGLLLDTGLLKPVSSDFSQRTFAPDQPEVVELRAMTIAIVDELATLINEKLAPLAVQLTLAQILEGGTWAAGRKLAFQRSASGEPPIRYQADGTLF